MHIFAATSGQKMNITERDIAAGLDQILYIFPRGHVAEKTIADLRETLKWSLMSFHSERGPESHHALTTTAVYQRSPDWFEACFAIFNLLTPLGVEFYRQLELSEEAFEKESWKMPVMMLETLDQIDEPLLEYFSCDKRDA